MNHVMTFREHNENMMNSTHSVGDVVLINYNGADYRAKIVKVNGENSYIVNLQFAEVFNKKPIAISGDSILQTITSNGQEDAMKSWVKVKTNVISNDMTLNNYPGNDGGGNGVYSPS